MTRYDSWEAETAVVDALVGHKVVKATDTTLTLDDGTKLVFDLSAFDCCSSVELETLRTTDNIITHAYFADNEEETGGEGSYHAWIHVVTEAGELDIAEADGNASNGYYLHGFALGVEIQAP